eukprot:TRINITY_DN667_c0_g1_i11.p1 TRINITY_DN667_c0_g1~~TRINITY_DN667_c0_g1_i11.p1  ORF type:complete len:932 (+),score=140.41 TRINITY_DN667_c0_g1_i11:79-2874(+)
MEQRLTGPQFYTVLAKTAEMVQVLQSCSFPEGTKRADIVLVADALAKHALGLINPDCPVTHSSIPTQHQSTTSSSTTSSSVQYNTSAIKAPPFHAMAKFGRPIHGSSSDSRIKYDEKKGQKNRTSNFDSKNTYRSPNALMAPKKTENSSGTISTSQCQSIKFHVLSSSHEPRTSASPVNSLVRKRLNGASSVLLPAAALASETAFGAALVVAGFGNGPTFVVCDVSNRSCTVLYKGPGVLAECPSFVRCSFIISNYQKNDKGNKFTPILLVVQCSGGDGWDLTLEPDTQQLTPNVATSTQTQTATGQENSASDNMDVETAEWMNNPGATVEQLFASQMYQVPVDRLPPVAVSTETHIIIPSSPVSVSNSSWEVSSDGASAVGYQWPVVLFPFDVQGFVEAARFWDKHDIQDKLPSFVDGVVGVYNDCDDEEKRALVVNWLQRFADNLFDFQKSSSYMKALHVKIKDLEDVLRKNLASQVPSSEIGHAGQNVSREMRIDASGHFRVGPGTRHRVMIMVWVLQTRGGEFKEEPHPNSGNTDPRMFLTGLDPGLKDNCVRGLNFESSNRLTMPIPTSEGALVELMSEEFEALNPEFSCLNMDSGRRSPDFARFTFHVIGGDGKAHHIYNSRPFGKSLPYNREPGVFREYADLCHLMFQYPDFPYGVILTGNIPPSDRPPPPGVTVDLDELAAAATSANHVRSSLKDVTNTTLPPPPLPYYNSDSNNTQEPQELQQQEQQPQQRNLQQQHQLEQQLQQQHPQQQQSQQQQQQQQLHQQASQQRPQQLSQAPQQKSSQQPAQPLSQVQPSQHPPQQLHHVHSVPTAVDAAPPQQLPQHPLQQTLKQQPAQAPAQQPPQPPPQQTTPQALPQQPPQALPQQPPQALPQQPPRALPQQPPQALPQQPPQALPQQPPQALPQQPPQALPQQPPDRKSVV